jgi:D-amino-acid oxidase
MQLHAAGLGSKRLAPDVRCFPTRGQVRRVRAPWIKHASFLDDAAYLIPNVDTLVVGGTAQVGDWRETIDGGDADAIWARMLALWPSLAHAEVVQDWVRPDVSSAVSCVALEDGQRTYQYTVHLAEQMLV